MRRAVRHAKLIFLATGALGLLAACGDEGSPADAGTDGGADAAPGDGASNADATPADAGTPIPDGSVLVHYHRPLADYAGWTLTLSGDAVETTVQAAADRRDGFGAGYLVTKKPNARTISLRPKNGAELDPSGTLAIDVSDGTKEFWVFSGYGSALNRAPGGVPGANQVVVYYGRPDNTYDGWGLHTWGDVARETQWTSPLPAAGVDPDFGAYFVIDVKPNAEDINIIVHKGDTKDPGPDMGWKRSVLGDIVFVVSGSTQIFAVPQRAGVLAISGAAAHLLSRSLLAWKIDPALASRFELATSTTAAIRATETDIVGGSTLALTLKTSGLGPTVERDHPYLRGFTALQVAPGDQAKIADALKGQLVAVARDAAGKVVKATQVQKAVILDALYDYEGPLGLSFTGRAPTFILWAPTAQDVTLHVFDDAKAEVASLGMTRTSSGTWIHAGPEEWYGLYYRYTVKVYHPTTFAIETTDVTDPYAVNLSTNGLYAQILDVRRDPALKPLGWDAFAKPALGAPEDIVVYEGHVRDFSASDPTVPAADRGKYLAFTATTAPGRSDGMAHLAALAAAGVTHVHLLPIFDVATIDEDPANRVDLDDPFSRLCQKNTSVPATLCTSLGGMTIRQAMASFPGDSETPQQIATYMHGLDGYNWGYDPFHFGAPEGSYASTAEGAAKIVELRRMVKALADVGLRVVMDVVYNHTNAAGLGDKSVLDKVVPGYYHRLNAETGFIENSTCCQNTATEHRMMERLMVDTLVMWARDYKVDGFRFDLMGHHMKADMLKARDTLRALTVGADGVDGSKIYLYGEGWDFGEVQNNSRGINATQANMAGTGIGTFNDRLRDAVRGGSPFDSGNAARTSQGFATGWITDPNELAPAVTPATKTKLFEATDRIKVSMAGNLKDFRLVGAAGNVTTGGSIGYNGARAGYTDDPQEAVNYVSAHDNQTFFDIAQYKLPTETSMADRVRVQNLALDVVALGQGVPFFHMGDDLLRSKSMERDSYDSGDWFNRIDWSEMTSAWKSGLPNEGKDGPSWELIRVLFGNALIAPTHATIHEASAHFARMIEVRKSSPLFRLTTKADVMRRVDFLNAGPSQIPGVILMTITDGTCAGDDLDPAHDAIVAIINADVSDHQLYVAGSSGFELHPLLAASEDTIVRGSSFADGYFIVPGRTTAVFVQPQGAAQGVGLPCNAR